MNRDFEQLRQVFEGSDPFLAGGHGIVKLRKRKRSIPEWTRSNKKVRELLLRSFPKLATDPRQRARAARWARIIHLYFRLQYTFRQTAEELEMKPGSVHFTIASIYRVSRGIWSNGQGKFKRGLPLSPTTGGGKR